jgi:hypothetical protein
MDNLYTVDLAVLESLHTMSGTFVSHVDFSDQEEGAGRQVAMDDNLVADLEDTYEFEAEEDYLNQLEAALTTKPQEEVRSPRSQ